MEANLNYGRGANYVRKGRTSIIQNFPSFNAAGTKPSP